MLLYLIRHGESTFNASGQIQGQSDVPLSELGARQAAALARALADVPIQAIYASPLRRALQTAQPIAEVLGLSIQTDPRLKEVDAGIFEARVRAEVEVEYPNELARWRCGELDYRLPGGESRRELIRRGADALRAIFQSGHEHVAVVAHGGVLLAGMKDILGLASEEPPLSMENASISILAWNGDGQAELTAFDRIDHLEDVERCDGRW